MLRLFQRGQNEEHTFNKELRAIGVEVVEVDAASGKQYSFKQQDNQHFSGSMDAAVLGLVEAPKTWHVIDYKTANNTKFKLFEKDGVRETEFKYYAQLIMYMFWSGMERAAIMISNKNDDSIYVERFKASANEARAFIDKAKRVVFSNQAPTKVGDADYYKCHWCDAYDVCHQDKVANTGCRTCCHSTPHQDGSWNCDRHGYHLTQHRDQIDGCGDHLFLPDLVPAKMIQGDTQANWILYEKKDGNVFVNCGIHFKDNDSALIPLPSGAGPVPKYTSDEVRGGFAVLGDPNVEIIREEFGASIRP